MPLSTPLQLDEVLGRAVRVIPYGHAATEEYVPGRVTFYLDNAGRVLRVQVETGEPIPPPATE